MIRLPRTIVGFAVINGFTFALDLAIVSTAHGMLGLPLALAVTLGYGVAFTLAFALNRRFNFRSHDPVGREVLRYVVVVAVNFGLILLGVTMALDALGVQYQVARIVAGACEGVIMYCAMRWFVFRRTDSESEMSARSATDAWRTAEASPPPPRPTCQSEIGSSTSLGRKSILLARRGSPR